MKELGGFFELELNKKEHYHSNAIKLNTGRNSLKYLLKILQPEKIYLPYYSCNAVASAVRSCNRSIEWYNIDADLQPVIDLSSIKGKNLLLYVNYFGLMNTFIEENLTEFSSNVIIDNSQSFYTKNNNFFSIYSPRKFFGVPDGGYLSVPGNFYLKDTDINDDFSFKRCEHLLKRIDLSAKDAYDSYLANEQAIEEMPVRRMSRLTDALLSNIDYEDVKLKRITNFSILSSILSSYNNLSFKLASECAPLCYPFLIEGGGELRKILISKKIYTPVYWPEVNNVVEKGTTEFELVNNLVCLPIDQRYTREDMQYIADVIKEWIDG